MKSLKVGIFGHYGNNNLGDEAIILAAIQNLRNRLPKAQLLGLSLKPYDTHERHKIESFPIRYEKKFFENKTSEEENSKLSNKKLEFSSLRSILRELLLKKIKKSSAVFGFLHIMGNLGSEIRFLRRVRDQLIKMDALIICGSNQFSDGFGGPWGFPYTILKWVLLAKHTDTKVIFASVGAGPISHTLSYQFIKRALVHADYLSFRDEGSRKMIKDYIPNINGFIYPDIAHSLKTLPTHKNPYHKQKTVAINPMPVFDNRYWFESKPKKYEAYVNHLANFINHLLNREFAVNLFNNHPSDLFVTEDLIKKLQETLDVDPDKVKVTHNKSIQDLIDTIDEADIIVPTRFHSTVLPLRLNKPILGICYYRKSKELLEDVGLGDYYVDIHEFTGEELITKFNSLFSNIDDSKEYLRYSYNHYTELMDEQWDRITDLIKG